MVEALLFGTPAIAVEDWMIPDMDPPRMASIPFDFVRKTLNAELTDTVEEVLTKGHVVEYRGETLSLQAYSDAWFSQ